MGDYQVIIVGSGPAGSACAKALKDENIETLVIEKESLPRPKTCSGILFGQTQLLLKEYFGALPPADVHCQPEIINASNIKEWKKGKGFSTYIWEIPKDGQSFPRDQHNIWRSKFDYWLLNETGVEWIESCTFRNYSLTDNKFNVEVSHEGKTDQDLSCSYLVGADGGNSQVRRLLDPSWIKQAQEAMVYQAYYRFSDMGSLEDGHWYVFLEPQIGDILSAVHRKDEFLTLCVGGYKGRSLKKSMEDFKNFLTENFQVVFGDMERDEGCIMRQAPPCLGKGNLLLIGDAAGLMYLNGEAISAALDSGYRAGKAIARGIKDGEDALETYQRDAKGIIDHMMLCLEQFHFFAA